MNAFYWVLGHWFQVAIFVVIGLGIAVNAARLLLVVLTAAYLQRLATRGPRAVTWLGWAVFVLTYLAFRRGTASPLGAAVAGGLAGGVAGAGLYRYGQRHHDEHAEHAGYAHPAPALPESTGDAGSIPLRRRNGNTVS